MADMDISKIVSLIMENPKLIEEIKNLAETEQKETGEVSQKEETVAEEITKPTAATTNENESRLRRKDLLCALKPYVSEERSKAIDSMMSIVDIIDMMRTK